MSASREKAGASVVGWLLLGLLALSGAAYGVAGLAAGDRLARGTTIAGVHVGGLTPNQARARLSSSFPDRKAAVTVGTRTLHVDPQAVGLSLDVDASLAQAAGDSRWTPAQLWEYYTGGDDFPGVPKVDQSVMDRWLVAIAGSLGQPARDGRVTFRNAQVHVVAPEGGQGIDPAAGRQALVTSFVTGDVTEIPMTTVAPTIDDRAVSRAVRRYANPAMSGPVTLAFGRRKIPLAPSAYADALSLVPEGGRLVPQVRRERLLRSIGSLASVASTPVDASFRVVDGRPVVVDARPGVRYRPADVVRAFLTAIVRPEGDREVAVPGVADPAGFTTRDARRLGVTEQVSTFSTQVDPATTGTATLLDGTVLEPGKTFSLRSLVGADEPGDALTTALFNTLYRAGLEPLERHAATSYRPGAPDGLDASVSGGRDLRFRNATRKGVLLTATAQGRVLTVSAYSTRVWDVRVRSGDRRNLVPSGRQVVRSPGCRASLGSPGFDVDVTRTFRVPGSSEVDHEDGFTVHYAPRPAVVCKRPTR